MSGLTSSSAALPARFWGDVGAAAVLGTGGRCAGSLPGGVGRRPRHRPDQGSLLRSRRGLALVHGPGIAHGTLPHPGAPAVLTGQPRGQPPPVPTSPAQLLQHRLDARARSTDIGRPPVASPCPAPLLRPDTPSRLLPTAS